MKVFTYVVAVSNNPDAVECVVPYKVNDNLIFFGPCKKRLREKFYKQYLKNSHNDEIDVFSKNLYVIGVNGSNSQKIRKIVWVGKIQRILTWEKAYHILSSEKEFEEMVMREDSPLNLEPIYDEKSGTFIGYRLRSKEHEKNDEWILDVVKSKNDPNVKIDLIEMTIILKEPSKRREVFLRDCCFFCENVFFAEGKGVDIDKSIFEIFKAAQPNKKDVSNYAIFGLTKDVKANGLPGSYLEISGTMAEKLIETVTKKAKKSAIHHKSFKTDIQPPDKC